MNTYYYPEEQALHTNVTNYERLMMYLNHKQYYPEAEMQVYLSENGLDSNELYNKNTDYRTNNIDVFRTVETEFATTTEAYNYLERRIQKLKQKIDEIPDEPTEGGRGSDFSHIFMD